RAHRGLQRFLELVVRMGAVDDQVLVTAGAQRLDRVGRRVDVLERGENAGYDARTPAHQCCAPRMRGNRIISLISWIATMGKVLAKSRNHIPNQPNDPARIPQSAQVGLSWSQAQGR